MCDRGREKGVAMGEGREGVVFRDCNGPEM